MNAFLKRKLALQEELASLIQAASIIRNQIVVADGTRPDLLAANDSLRLRIEAIDKELDIVDEAILLENDLPLITLRSGKRNKI